MISHLRGEIIMPFIEEEMKAFDDRTVEIPIIDHSRLAGLNNFHPDVKETYSLAYKIIMYHLDQMWDDRQSLLNVEDIQLDNVFEQIPEVESLMRRSAMKSSSHTIAKDLATISHKLSEPEDDPTDKPESSVLNENYPGDDLELLNGHINLIIRVVNTDSHDPNEERTCPNTWSLDGVNFIITIDGYCHCLKECRNNEERYNVMSILCSDVIINFIQNKTVPSMHTSSVTDMLVTLQLIQTKHFETMTTLIHSYLQKQGI